MEIEKVDGRRHRPTTVGPQEPLNVDVPPHVKQLAVQAKVQFGLTMKTFVAEAIEHYYRTLQRPSEASLLADLRRALERSDAGCAQPGEVDQARRALREFYAEVFGASMLAKREKLRAEVLGR